MLINDSCVELTGQIRIQVHGANREGQPEDTISLLVPANQGSPLIMRNLADYQIPDFRRASVEAVFEPDAETLTRIKALEERVNQRLGTEAPALLDAFGTFSMTEGFKAHANFVESQYQHTASSS
jgi:hypothetical protein